MTKAHPDQSDFFARPVFPVRSAVPDRDLDMDRFRLRVKAAMSAALRDKDRVEIAARMARMVRSDTFSKGMLDAYCAMAKDSDISLVRFKALVRAADAPALWDIVLSDDGLLVLRGDEARLAELARLQQEKRKLAAEIRRLQQVPVHLDVDRSGQHD